MAKKARTKGNSEPLPGMEEEFEVPEQLQKAADEYARALKAKNRATSKFNTARDNAIAAMGDEGVDRVRIQTDKGEKWLALTNEDKLKLEKVKEPGEE